MNEDAKSDPSEDGNTYGIDCLNMGEAENESESKSEWLLAQRRKYYMANNINKDNSIRNEFNVLSNIYKSYNTAKYKIYH